MEELENLKYQELENIATSIIQQAGHTREDVKTLSQIKYFLSLKYKTINTLSSVHEAQYNNHRSTQSTKLQEDMAVGKAENIAKSEAENQYGIYRQENAEAQGISKIIEAVGWFIISIQSELKALDQTQF